MTPTVLVCEDEERIVDLFRTIIEPLGVECVAAKDGQAALELLLERPFALLLLDLVVPRLDGFALLSRMSELGRFGEMPVIVISAMADSATIRRVFELGAVSFVAKPFNVDILEAKLRVFLRMRGLAVSVKQRQAFLEDVVDHLSSGLMVVDSAGAVVKINAAGAISLGCSQSVLVGRKISEIVPGAEAMFVVSGGSLQHRLTIQTTLGERTLGFTNAIVEVNGAPGAVAVFRELNEVEAAQRKRHDQLRRQELAASARNFAHEVKSPLTAISGAAQVIARENCTEPQRVRLARAIESEANRINQLVEEYVERRHAQHDERTLDLAGLLSEVVEVNLLNAPERARVSISCEADLPIVRVDGAHLKQVVLNLVQNAIKATTHDDSIRLLARRDEEGVVLIVTDTGCGIAMDALPRIFDEGYSTRTGGGLGLSIARDIVESHGGTITAQSTIGKGTTFTVWLPS